jgi:hypothetical protein
MYDTININNQKVVITKERFDEFTRINWAQWESFIVAAKAFSGQVCDYANNSSNHISLLNRTPRIFSSYSNF